MKRLPAMRRFSSRSFAVLVAVSIFFGPAFFRCAVSAEQDSGSLLGGRAADGVYDAQYLLRQAEQGDACAAFLLGTRFASAGGGRDDSEAFRWFEQAAEAGLAEAQFNLGVMYASGRGVARNLAAAARWYEEAANQGVAEAQFNIGTLYALGAGVEKDEVHAAEWLQRAAVKSLPQAQFNLGVLHEHGRGVRLDARTAMAWYRRAAEQGYEPAKQRLQALEAKFSSAGGTSPESPVAVSTASMPTAAAPQRTEPPVPVQPAASDLAGAGSAAGWLERLDPQQYTLQLLSDTDPANVRRFVAAHVDAGQGGYFSSRINGDIWYSVVYGAYPSYDLAKAASEQLPPKLRKLKPWIRKVDSVLKQIER